MISLKIVGRLEDLSAQYPDVLADMKEEFREIYSPK